jgi:glycosyltransferase involved in cell wall biosynthesis
MFLLMGARALIFPSLYEGFGIPALEAMVMGCPVITSKATAMREVCGDAALYVDPLDTKDIAAAIDALATDDLLGGNLIERGKRQAVGFSSDRYAEKLEQGYQLALKA